jgi:hypothetical protein
MGYRDGGCGTMARFSTIFPPPNASRTDVDEFVHRCACAADVFRDIVSDVMVMRREQDRRNRCAKISGR